MNTYEVVEVVRQTVERERRWVVQAISEQDAVRLVVAKQAANGYRGLRYNHEQSAKPEWRVNGNQVAYRPSEAIPVDDGTADIGNGD